MINLTFADDRGADIIIKPNPGVQPRAPWLFRPERALLHGRGDAIIF